MSTHASSEEARRELVWRHKAHRALLDLIELATALGHDADDRVREAKEVIRCSVTGCGNAGACDGIGSRQYPCPVKESRAWLARARSAK